jgi:hypothetical protein
MKVIVVPYWSSNTYIYSSGIVEDNTSNDLASLWTIFGKKKRFSFFSCVCVYIYLSLFVTLNVDVWVIDIIICCRCFWHNDIFFLSEDNFVNLLDEE